MNMMKMVRAVFFLSIPLFLSGCESVDRVIDWLSDFIPRFMDTLICAFLTVFFGFINLFIDLNLKVFIALLSILPQYTPPEVTLSNFTFLRYAAYFLPISEGATLMKYFIKFYITFWIGRVVLRWLKVLK